MNNEILRELFIAMKQLGASPDLLSVVGSINDTLDDTEILNLLRRYNSKGFALEEDTSRLRLRS